MAGDNPAGISTGSAQRTFAAGGRQTESFGAGRSGNPHPPELHVRAVTHRLLRGRTPEHVRVVFEVRGTPAKFEASVPKLVYRTDGGFSGLVRGTATVGWQAFTLGAVSDGDDLAERYTGFMARYEDKRLESDRIRFRVDFESYRDAVEPSHRKCHRSTRQRRTIPRASTGPATISNR